MKKRIASISIFLFLAGCSNYAPIPDKPYDFRDIQPIPQGKHDYVAELRAEVHRRGMKFYIACWTKDISVEEYLIGDVASKDVQDTSTSVIEDGGGDRWLEGGSTFQEVAYKLLEALKGSPTHPAKHREAKKEEATRKCPPIIRGD